VSAHRPPGARLCSFPPQPRPAQRALTWSQPGYGLPQLSASATVDLRLGNDHDFTAALRKNERINYGCWPLVSSDAVTAWRRSSTSPGMKLARKPYLLRLDRVQLRSACRQGPHFGPARMGLLQQPHRLAIGAQFGQASRTRPGSQGFYPLLPPVRNRGRSNPHQAINPTNTSPLSQQPGADHPAHLQCFCATSCRHGPDHIHTSLLSQHDGE